MCKISQRSLHYNLDKNIIKFSSNLNYDAKSSGQNRASAIKHQGPFPIHYGMFYMDAATYTADDPFTNMF